MASTPEITAVYMIMLPKPAHRAHSLKPKLGLHTLKARINRVIMATSTTGIIAMIVVFPHTEVPMPQSIVS